MVRISLVKVIVKIIVEVIATIKAVVDGCIHVVDCRLGRRICNVICKAAIADRNGTAV